MSTGLADAVKALARVSDRPNLTALSYALRHPEMWPADFVWSYERCSQCAIGLALRLWPGLTLPDGQDVQETWIAREMAMNLRAARHVFFGLAPDRRGWLRTKTLWDAVTADDVADAIDAYLEGTT